MLVCIWHSVCRCVYPDRSWSTDDGGGFSGMLWGHPGVPLYAGTGSYHFYMLLLTNIKRWLFNSSFLSGWVSLCFVVISLTSTWTYYPIPLEQVWIGDWPWAHWEILTTFIIVYWTVSRPEKILSTSLHLFPLPRGSNLLVLISQEEEPM